MKYDNTSAAELRKHGIKRINYILLWGLNEHPSHLEVFVLILENADLSKTGRHPLQS
nr:hypothetical protein [uncultured Macellibacteroides sp.]